MAQIDARGLTVNNVKGDQYNHIDVHVNKEVIQHCLNCSNPITRLSLALSSFRLIWKATNEAKMNKSQLCILSECVAQLLKALDIEYRADRLKEDKSASQLEDLNRLLDHILSFVREQEQHDFLKTLYVKDDRISRIQGYHQRLFATTASFQISALVSIQEWQVTNEEARKVDQRLLYDRLSDLQSNQNMLAREINAKQDTVMEMIVSLQRHLQNKADGDRERQFFSHTLQYLTTTSGHVIEVKSWMIGSDEVNFGLLIGTGGFGEVYQGTWNKRQVALKSLKTNSGLAPSSTSIRREVEIWSKVHHPHIIEFLGANISDRTPFIVMPYFKNGHVRDYLLHNPTCNRTPILHHISLGIAYLHANKIVHGDLKGPNVLIDDNGRAILCDFGLTRIKGDVTSQTSAVAADSENIVGSRNWMAPERLCGGNIRMPCDVYAFGMTLYEIYTNEIPLGHIFVNFIELVVDRHVRPERPDNDEAPQLSDEIWSLAEQCWVADKTKRPNAEQICRTVGAILSKDILNPIVFESEPLVVLSSPLNTTTEEAQTVHKQDSKVTKDRPSPLTIQSGSYYPELDEDEDEYEDNDNDDDDLGIDLGNDDEIEEELNDDTIAEPYNHNAEDLNAGRESRSPSHRGPARLEDNAEVSSEGEVDDYESVFIDKEDVGIPPRDRTSPHARGDGVGLSSDDDVPHRRTQAHWDSTSIPIDDSESGSEETDDANDMDPTSGLAEQMAAEEPDVLGGAHSEDEEGGENADDYGESDHGASGDYDDDDYADPYESDGW